MGDARNRDIAAAQLIELELIRRFIAVAEELNFTRAAARLGPDTSRSRAVAGFVRAAVEVAASHTELPAALT